MLRTIVSLAAITTIAFGQTARFDVASIKPSSPDAHGSSIMTDKVGGLNVENATVRALITLAYGIRDFQLTGGPGWIGTDRYDVMAKPVAAEATTPAADPGSLTEDQRKVRDELWKERMQNLLAERFGLVMHKETRDEQIYTLSLAKGGSKLALVETPGNRQGISANRGRMQGFAAPASMLATSLSGIVERPVIDKTELTGKYDWVLNYDPNISGAQNRDNAGSDEQRPAIFTAVQDQLGLKLESTKGPVDTWVIDKINHPSEN